MTLKKTSAGERSCRESTITILRCGNQFVVDTLDLDLIDRMSVLTTFEAGEFEFLDAQQIRTLKRRAAERNETFHHSSFKTKLYTCYELDHRGRLGTSFGFFERISKFLEESGFQVRVEELRQRDKSVMVPDWDWMYRHLPFDLRSYQEETLLAMVDNEHGRIDLPPASGKSKTICAFALLMRFARIAIVSKSSQVLRQRLLPELRTISPHVGMIDGKSHDVQRITCVSAASLHKADFGNTDIVLADECHELAADTYAKQLARFRYARCYGLSASHDLRLDKKDFRLEQIFGPVVQRASYAEFVAAGWITPLEVHWTSVPMEHDPAAEADHPVQRKRLALWTNEYRNQLIATDARRFEEDVQVLITVETVIHGLMLRLLLPEFTLVYSPGSVGSTKREQYEESGLMSTSEPMMTPALLHKLSRDFEKGRIKKAIATSVWNVGVDFRDLAAIVRADGGSSPINDVQIPGRGARKGVTTDKPTAIVQDYLDQFNKPSRTNALTRQKQYKRQEFRQVFPRGYSPRDPELRLDHRNYRQFPEETM